VSTLKINAQPTSMLGVQERACQLTAALAMDDAACSSFVPDGVKGLLDLCSSSVAAPVREQACFALCRIARPSPGCHACVHLQTLGASQVLLQLLKGMFLFPGMTKFAAHHWL